MKNNLVFCYGTLLSQGSRPAAAFVNAEVLGKATAPGRIYDLGWFPGFKKCEDIYDACEVIGELIAVDQIGLEHLDTYEGCPDLYRRDNTLVQMDDGTLKNAFVYVYNGQPHADDVIPEGDFIAYMKERG